MRAGGKNRIDLPPCVGGHALNEYPRLSFRKVLVRYGCQWTRSHLREPKSDKSLQPENKATRRRKVCQILLAANKKPFIRATYILFRCVVFSLQEAEIACQIPLATERNALAYICRPVAFDSYRQILSDVHVHE